MISFETSAEIKEYIFVKLDTDGKAVAASASTDNIIGVSDTINTLKGDYADILMNGEKAEITAGGTIAAGDALTADENGYAVKAVNGDNIGAVAHTSAVKGDVIPVTVCINRTIAAAETAKE